MENTSWLKQASEPLFPDLLWSRPENKSRAGKLLIIGGNTHGFSSPAGAFAAAEKAGIGTVRVLLPDQLQKTLGKTFTEAEFAPSTISGGFNRQALAGALEKAEWADGVLLAGDFGKNSETAIFTESFLEKYSKPATLAEDSLDYFLDNDNLLGRKKTALVLDFGRLQALARKNQPIPPLMHKMSLYDLVKALAQWSSEAPPAFIVTFEKNVLVANGGKVSTTPLKGEALLNLAAYISVWWLQNPSKTFEALTTAVWASAQN